jgi:hypothetical protein
MIRRHAVTLAIAATLMALAGPSAARPRLADLRGHLLLGYAKLFAGEAPGGSLSIGAGVEHPLRGSLGVGLDVGYHLLGSRTLVQGTLSSGLDYSVFEALAQVHWATPGGGPQVVLSGGPGLFVARANLASSPIGAVFSSRAVEETRPGLALGAIVTQRRASPVRVGFEAGLRIVPLDSDTWTLATARLAILY